MTDTTDRTFGKRATPAPDGASEPRFTDRVEWLLNGAGDELTRALLKFDAFNSPHEGWAVIKEELDELWDHVRSNTARGVSAQVEAMQVAAMALRFAHDLAEWGPGVTARSVRTQSASRGMSTPDSSRVSAEERGAPDGETEGL